MGTITICTNPECDNKEEYTTDGKCPKCGEKLEKQEDVEQELQPGM